MTPSVRALPRLSARDAQALVDLACAIEERANRLKDRDPEAYRAQDLGRLHKAAALLGAAGRDLRRAISEEQRK